MKNSQNGFITPLLIVIIVVLLVGGSYLYMQKNKAGSPATGNVPANIESNPTQNTSPVEKISWHTEKENPAVVDDNDPQKLQQAIYVDVTFVDKSTKRYGLGKAYGCNEVNVAVAPELGRMSCYYSLVGVGFVAYNQNGRFIVERHDESAKDGSITKTILLEI